MGSMIPFKNMLQKVELGKNVDNVNHYAFNGCHSLASVTIPNGVKYVGQYTFAYNYRLKCVVIPKIATSINNYAFNGCKALENVVVPISCTYIGANSFYQCIILKPVIPNGVKKIYGSVFYELLTITKLVIPNSVASIESKAFYGCSCVKIYDFTEHTSVPTLSNKDAFGSMANDCEFHVPASLYDSWVKTTNWSTYADRIVAV
jgi:hypothetical protein